MRIRSGINTTGKRVIDRENRTRATGKIDRYRCCWGTAARSPGCRRDGMADDLAKFRACFVEPLDLGCDRQDGFDRPEPAYRGRSDSAVATALERPLHPG